MRGWDRAIEGAIWFPGGRIRYLNPAAEALLGVRADRVLGAPLIHALRDRRLLRLAEAGGEAELWVRGRRVFARAAGEWLYLLELPPDDAEERAQLLHELRTPLAAILGLLGVLEDAPPEERAEVLATLRAEAERMRRLVESGGYAPEVPPYPLAALRERLVRVLPAAAGVAWEDGGVRLRVDPDALFQILLNLVENALLHGRPPVSVAARPAGEALYLEVLDAGPPLPDYEGLFAPGARGPAAAQARGTGLGLAIVRRVARGFGGEAYAERRGEANVFGVRLPPGLWFLTSP